jgi:phosphatidylglycerophosphate synthase
MVEALANTAAPARRPVRPRELEDALNYYLYHPLARRLARLLAATPLTPNMVSIGGALCVVAAGIAYIAPLWHGLAWPLSAALGMALHMTWHVVDGADGDLARMTGRVSPYGEMIDGLCDYASHVVLYTLLAILLTDQIGLVAWLIAVAAGLAHAIQSNHVEAQRRFYLHWVYGKPWLHNRREGTSGGMAWLIALYLRVAAGMTPHALAIDEAIVAASGRPERLEGLRAMVRAESGPLLRMERLLGPNQRAIALGVVMLATGSPLLYFAYGGLWLSALLAVSVVLHNRAARRLAERIGQADVRRER